VFYITGGPRDLMPYIPTEVKLGLVNKGILSVVVEEFLY
jgi:hypothetical protein